MKIHRGKVDTTEEAAKKLGISRLALQVIGACGCPGLEEFAPFATSQSDVAQHFGVARSTVSDWASHGMPQEADGSYNLLKVRDWRLSRGDSPEYLTKGASALAKRGATGDLIRGLCRVQRMAANEAIQCTVDEFIPLAIPDASDGERDRIGEMLGRMIAKNFDSILPTEKEAERLIADCARLI